MPSHAVNTNAYRLSHQAQINTFCRVYYTTTTDKSQLFFYNSSKFNNLYIFAALLLHTFVHNRNKVNIYTKKAAPRSVTLRSTASSYCLMTLHKSHICFKSASSFRTFLMNQSLTLINHSAAAALTVSTPFTVPAVFTIHDPV